MNVVITNDSEWVLTGHLHFNLSHLFKPNYIIVLFKILRLHLELDSNRKKKELRKMNFHI